MTVDSPEYHRQIIELAAESAPGGPLSTRPYLDAALRSFRYVIDPQMAGEELREVCRDVLISLMLVMGADD